MPRITPNYDGSIVLRHNRIIVPDGLLVRPGTLVRIKGCGGIDQITLMLTAEAAPTSGVVLMRGLIPKTTLEESPTLTMLLGGSEVRATMLGREKLGFSLGLVPDGEAEAVLELTSVFARTLLDGPRMEEALSRVT